MGKRFFKRWASAGEGLRNHAWLNRLAPGLKCPLLWHLNRRSVARAMAIGLFWALIPMPWQMVPAAVSAVRFRGHVPIAVALVWLSNPFTWGPLWYGTYRLGRWLLGQEPVTGDAGSWQWMTQHMHAVWQPLYLGSFVVGLLLATIGYFSVHVSWRAGLATRWAARRRRLAVGAGPSA